MAISALSEKHSWWADLRQSGLLISPPLLDEAFPNGPAQPSDRVYDKLRDRFNAFGAWLDKHDGVVPSHAEPLHTWLDAVLETFLGYDKQRWNKGSNVPQTLTVETALRDRLRPDRVLYLDADKSHPALAVCVDRAKRVGMGRGRTAYSKLIELLRGTGLKLGLLTNGSQFRLCYAGLDHDCWVEWDAANWFDEGELRTQLDGFLTLLGPAAFTSEDGAEFPLLAAVQASRTRQGELSSVLGEQVRQAVELLLFDVERAARRHATLLDRVQKLLDGSELPRKRVLEALYQAASRIVMRLVVILYAEARGMLPRSLQSYNSAYGLEGLFAQLRRAMTYEGHLVLTERFGAWPRAVSLFRLIHEGSSHHHLPVPAYGGSLFRPGVAESDDQVLRAVSVFEDQNLEVSDATVLRILELLKIGSIKIRRGRTSTMARGPVDFSQLRTEYIGILYEGLLDYELKSADKTMVFLNVGQQPILPLDLLESLSDRDLKDLLSKLGKEIASGPAASEESDSTDEDADSGVAEEQEEHGEEGEVVQEEVEEDIREGPEEYGTDTRTEADLRGERAHEWALRTVEVAGLVRKPRGRSPNLYQYEKEKQAAARRLIARVLDQGELYLARWGGTRKGSGTFYTKPGLAVPTVYRTLEPLAYSKAEVAKLIPKTPEEILSIKVCDPACGSGSFLVAALNYLTEALYQSLLFHQRIREADQQAVVTLPFGRETRARLEEETFPVPMSDERFETILKARLKRHVVERCIYGVDLSPMAVELARLSLWIETMDPALPFGFLDHKIKCGNSLVGCWFDRFLDYPLAAWLRKGGDENHARGAHFEKEEWTKRIKATLNERVKPELVRQIQAHTQHSFSFMPSTAVPETLHDEAVSIFESMHSLQVSTPDGIEQRELIYTRDFLNNPNVAGLREAFDTWCAVWFWPADLLGDEALTPANFYEPSELTRQVVSQLRGELKFFHWELEFPDVFASTNSGFDAVLGNPPWEISKPNSKEFFSNHDPIYRTYGKQEALSHQTRLFMADREIEKDWLTYCARFKATGNWVNCAGHPFGDPEVDSGEAIRLIGGRTNLSLHADWRARRRTLRGYADAEHPFRHQGSADINTYKMSLEVSHALLKRGGRIGMITPSGLYTDKGATALRALFLDRCHWEWLLGFENKRGIFDIHRSFKFCPVVLEKGGETESFNAAFMRHDLTDWETAEKFSIPYTRDQVTRFSPYSRAVLEIRSHRDLEIIEKIYDGAILLGDRSPDGWQIEYAREFDMTNDSKLFPPRPVWEERDYRPDAYGRWLKGEWRPISEAPSGSVDCIIGGSLVTLEPGIIPSVDANQYIHEDDIEDIALPLYEGRMIGQFDFSQKGWVSGKGRRAVWRDVPWSEKTVEPQYLMSAGDYASVVDKDGVPKARRGNKVAFMDVTSATNQRTTIASFILDEPCGNSAPVLVAHGMNLRSSLLLVATLNSLSFDFSVRARCGGLHLNWFVMEETPLAPYSNSDESSERALVLAAAALNCSHRSFGGTWIQLINRYKGSTSFKLPWALSRVERLRLQSIIDAIVAEQYGLSFDDFAWILRADPSDPKGFWRVDRNRPIETRQTTLALAAFRDLKQIGLEAFCSLQDPDGLPGCGWQIPETLTFAVRDGGITEFDAQGGDTYVVRELLGTRFQPLQFDGKPEDTLSECELHARNILGEEQFKHFIAHLRGELPQPEANAVPTSVIGADGQQKLFATGHPNLFGADAPPPPDRKRRR